MTNVVGLQTDDAGYVDQNSSAHVARIVGLQTDAVVVTETRYRINLCQSMMFDVEYFFSRLLLSIHSMLYRQECQCLADFLSFRPPPFLCLLDWW